MKKSLSLGLDHGELRKKITRKKVKTGEMRINLNDFFILKKIILYIYIYKKKKNLKVFSIFF